MYIYVSRTFCSKITMIQRSTNLSELCINQQNYEANFDNLYHTTKISNRKSQQSDHGSICHKPIYQISRWSGGYQMWIITFTTLFRKWRTLKTNFLVSDVYASSKLCDSLSSDALTPLVGSVTTSRNQHNDISQ